MSDSEEDANLPSREECEERCQQFASVSGTDTALAMFYLQDRGWDLDKALNAYFEASSQSPGEASESSNKLNHTDGTKKNLPLGEPADPEPHRFRLLSWNIDGLDLGNLRSRTKAVCSIIKAENPHVVFLQEVIPSSLEILQEECPTYKFVPGGNHDYFTAILLKKEGVAFEDSSIYPFFSSQMMRNLLKVKCSIKGIPFQLITSHLESTKAHAGERQRQLKTAFQEVSEADADRTVVFGGDLNLRDPEVEKVGGVPSGIFDLWEVTGARPEAKFTWDTTRNDNLNWDAKFRPKCRFDRLYIKHPSGGKKVKPVYFELVGLERIKTCQCFPSDHWGILTHYDILSP